MMIRLNHVLCRVGRSCLIMALIFLMDGCAATKFNPSGRTGGVELTLSMLNQDGGSAALYTVTRDGTLGFGGGMEARNGRTSWTGSMTDDQIGEFLGILERNDWFRTKPESTGLPKGLTYRITINGSEGRNRYIVNGYSESVREVKNFLDEIASERFEPILRQLPKPGKQD
ncbi:MAG: hypothetical protein O7G85_03840 [Planctomycetota bacterium]|nr:hypothetical protein [Planctomycetota bacterium]